MNSYILVQIILKPMFTIVSFQGLLFERQRHLSPLVHSPNVCKGEGNAKQKARDTTGFSQLGARAPIQGATLPGFEGLVALARITARVAGTV